MTIDDILLETEEKMLKTEEHLVQQFAGVRTGKASPALIENVMVEAYGSQMRLKELATISAPESRMLMVTPFDQSNVKAIEKGIQASNLGLNPATQGKFIRIVLPDLSTERRQEFVKICRKMAEDSRVSLRNERRHAIEGLKKVKAAGGVSEDQVETAEAEVQKLTDQYIAKLDQHLAHKEKEILTV
ncbi:MAG: ribosome recycling factor [Verrucomicrobiae bacterium]|nr:ribosome recycling factor [Verrucomicrobiae bacterium]